MAHKSKRVSDICSLDKIFKMLMKSRSEVTKKWRILQPDKLLMMGKL